MGSLHAGQTTFGCKQRALGFFREHALAKKTTLKWPAHTVCSLRDKGKPRKPLWRGRVMTTEAIQAVQALKRASKCSQDKFEMVFNTRISRLLKADLLAALAELQRQNECELALKIFDLVRKEVWYKPDLSLYADMILALGRNKLIDRAEQILSQLKEEGLEPNTIVYTELLGAYERVGMIEKAMHIYEEMKKKPGCRPNELTFSILINSLERLEARDLASVVRKECVEYLDEPTEFLAKHANKVATG